MVLEYALIAPKMSGSYSTADFLEEMKGVFRTVVLKKRQVNAFLLTHPPSHQRRPTPANAGPSARYASGCHA
jgi:hypothetical protein